MSKAIARFGALCVVLIAVGMAGAAPAQAGPSDPLFLFTPAPAPPPAAPIPPPDGYLEGPCGLAVDSAGSFYVSDYYHHAVDVFSPGTDPPSYQGQLANEDPLDGPCGLALDTAGNLYVNDFHKDVAKFGPGPAFSPGPIFDSEHPTGVAVDPATNRVYVDDRTYVAVYDSSGAPVLNGEGHAMKVGLGSLQDGYGVALSAFPPTAGRLYVPDAATDTVKVYEPAIDEANPVATIDGHETPNGQFVSLRDSAVAVDRATGNVYLADNLQPKYSERPEAAIYVFGLTGIYLGRLKYNIVDALPPGLAVDNSAGGSQGRVYVTSGNTDHASVLAYPPGAQTGVILPPPSELGAGKGEGEPNQPGGTTARSACEGACAPDRPAERAQASKLTQKGNLRLSVDGRLSPHKLPRTGTAPISVSVGWKVASTDSSPVPALRQIRLEINRAGRFDSKGLPTCPYNRIQPASSSRALANCRSALVGRGSFEANVALKGQEAYVTHGRLLVFNGKSHGKAVLFGQIYSPRPFATSFVIVFAVQSLHHGTYGTALTATLPKALAGWGNLTAIAMTLSRRYSYKGASHSYISAGCPAPKGTSKASFPLARASFGFAGGTQLGSVLSDTCRARG